jgi:hypothetical protein
MYKIVGISRGFTWGRTADLAACFRPKEESGMRRKNERVVGHSARRMSSSRRELDLAWMKPIIGSLHDNAGLPLSSNAPSVGRKKMHFR